jgi:PAS domain S-box-containing protein
MNETNKRYTFIVIEDSRGDFALIEDHLNEQFIRPSITHVTTFHEALSIFRSENISEYDCIILDLSLPDKSGHELIEGIVRLSEGLPVLVLTGYSDLSFSVQALAAGVSDYLLKDELTATRLHKSIIYSIKRNDFSERIKTSENKYRTLFELSPEPMWLTDASSGSFIDANHAAVSHYGYSKDEFLSMTVDDILVSEQQNPGHSDEYGVIAGEDNGNGHYYSHRKKNGDLIKVEIESNEIEYEDKAATLVLVNDVTEKLRLEKRRKLLESVVTHTTDSVAILDVSPQAPHPRIVYVNGGFKEMTGYDEDDIRNRSLAFLCGEETDPQDMQTMEDAIHERKSAEVEIVNYRKNGQPFWTQISFFPVEGFHGEDSYMIATGRDISSRKESEKKLQVSLNEKEVLLSEIHHRVKNNLALVSGMLQMQVFDEENEEVINKLNNSMLRVETMASIHQLLYESSSFSRLEFSKIINKLINATHESFSGDRDIDIEIDTEPFELNINQAVPCSLIINEVITNVYKHAFKDRKKGWIKAVLRCDEDLVTFKVEDDGKGLPEDFDISDLSSLGTKIITALVKQLNGTFELVPREGGGTVFSLRFPVKNKKGSGNPKD